MSLSLALLALGVEGIIGYPARVYRSIGHPVTWMGALLTGLERRLNHEAEPFPTRRAKGVLTLCVLLGATALVSAPLDIWLSRSWAGLALLALLSASLPAQRSLDTHVRAVADALEREGIEAARRAVGMIVGRNTAVLDEAGVARAAIESLAENFSDGVVAPAFWIAIGGLTGGALYKAANTADSMIGHKTPRYAAFGWAAARFDDLVNLPASRLAAGLVLLAAPLCGASARDAWRAIRRDATHHRSPNAGWPEAAFAGALGLRLAGPRVYGSAMVEDAFMGDGRREAGPADIRHALRLYRTACGVQMVALGILLFVL